MLTIILILVIVMLLFITYCTNNYEGFEQKINFTEKTNLLRCMLTLHELCVKHEIWYNIAFGTLLGAVRHRGMIPWDDDIDIFVMKNDLPKMEEIFEILTNDFGYKVDKTWKLIRVYADKTHFIDLFIIDNVDDKIVRCQIDNCTQINEAWWKNEYGFSSNLLGTKKMYHYDSLYLYGPENAKELLTHWYGSDFLTTCKTHYLENHNTYVTPETFECEQMSDPQFP